MKRIYILILSMASTALVNAQITLTSSNNNPKIGDNFTYHIIDGSTINSGASGANVTWDFSNIVSTSKSMSTIVAPSSLSDNINHPLANAAAGNSGSESYLFIDSDEYSLEGAFSAALRDVYSDVRELYKFPITYQDVFNETFSGTSTNRQASFTYERSGTIKIEADAYGTLKLPYGTINDVLRIKTTTNYGDVFMGSPLVNYEDVHYFWFNASTKTPIMTYDEFTIVGATTVYVASYLDQSSIITGLGDHIVDNDPMVLYPNPASSVVNIQLDRNYKEASLQIMDLTGKIVRSESLDNNIIKTSFQLEDLEEGIYFVQILENDMVQTSQKLVVK